MMKNNSSEKGKILAHIFSKNYMIDLKKEKRQSDDSFLQNHKKLIPKAKSTSRHDHPDQH
jgi:hypothetical protein